MFATFLQSWSREQILIVSWWYNDHVPHTMRKVSYRTGTINPTAPFMKGETA